MPIPPLILVDNVFDTVVLYRDGFLSATSEAPGREAFRISDYRRDRTWWQAADDGRGVDHRITLQLTAAPASIDYIFLDRGHNLAGKTIVVEGGNDGVTWPTSVSIAVSSMVQTEEGAAWQLLTPTSSLAFWSIRIPHVTGFIPIVSGLMLGARTQLLNFGKTFDEDAGGRTQPSQQSTAGYRANDPTYAWRTVTLDLDLIGAAEYDGTMRSLRAKLFEKNQPWVCAMDYGTRPERAWMYTLDGTTWGMPKSHVYRAGRIVGREHMPRLT
jgi:hypothetical protein